MLSCPFLIIYLTLFSQSLLEILDSNLTRAQRDNDLIYHQDVPSVSSLPVIQSASMVSSTVPPGLLETIDADCMTGREDRKSTRLNSSHQIISYAVFCLKKKHDTSAAHTKLN